MNPHIETLKKLISYAETWRGKNVGAEKDVEALLSAIADMERLDWLLALIHDKGTNGIADLPWTVVIDDGEDSEIAFDREAIDAARNAEKDQTPICPSCGNSANMVKHQDGEWVCHATHRIDQGVKEDK